MSKHIVIKKVAIIGGGSTSLIIANLLGNEFEVSIYEKGKTIGRKYLVAGKGGFNLSNNQSVENLQHKYTPVGFLDEALKNFDVSAIQAWYTAVGIETFIGSSGRIFPVKGISPADVLRAIKTKLAEQGVAIHLNHEFIGFSPALTPVCLHQNAPLNIEADYYIYCLGGASWKVTGSDGTWLSLFENIGVRTIPFQPSNCGLNINWPESLKPHEGKPLKNIAVRVFNKKVKGEALIAKYGLEGNAIYPIASSFNNLSKEDSWLSLDLKPQLTTEEISKRLSTKGNIKKALHLDSAKMALLKAFTTREEYGNSQVLTHKIKNLLIPVDSLRPIDEAISTTGGISIDELTPEFALKKIPNSFVVGEMVDWDAPTGGYLLQGCFSMGSFVAQSIKTDNNLP